MTRSTNWALQCRRLAFVGAIFSIVLGLAVLLGWWLGLKMLTNPDSGYGSMNPVTAMAFIFTGMGLILALLRPRHPRLVVPAVVLAGSVGCVNLLKFLAYLFGSSFPIEQFVMGGELSGSRVAPNTAICLLLDSMGLLLLLFPALRAFWAARILVIASGCGAVLAIAGYSIDSWGLYELTYFTSMAPETAAGLIVLAGALLTCAAGLETGAPTRHPDLEQGDHRLEKTVNRGFAVAFGVSCLVGGASYLSHTEFISNVGWSDHTLRILVAIGYLTDELADSETAMRESGMVAAPHDLNRHRSLTRNKVAELRALIRDNPGQMQRIARIESALAGYDRSIQEAAAAAAGPDPSHGLPSMAQTQLVQMRSILAEMANEENRLLAIRSDRTTRSARRSIMIIYSSGVAGFIVVASALIFVRRTIAAQWRADRKFRDLLESAPEAMVIVNERGEIVLVNSQTEQLFGYERGELLHLPVEILIPERFRAEHPPKLRSFFENPCRRPLGRGLQLYGMHKTNGEFPVDIGLSPIETQEGLLVSASIRDVSPRLKIEDTLRLKNEQLELASDAKDRFLAHMSHEIRTPLNGTAGMLELMLRTQLTPQQSRYVQLARSSAESLTTIIDDILDFSKIRAGKLELRCVPFDVYVVVEDVVAMLAARALHKKLELISHVDAAIPRLILSDPDRLRQILLNLGGNAIKFTKSGTVSISVSKDAESDTGITLRFAVQDTGVGIPSDRMDRLFKSFSQVDSSTTRRFGGTGLGLAISKELVELMGGTLGVESEFGKGSTFWFSICCCESCQPAHCPKQIAPERLRILVVDDNATSRATLKAQVESWEMQAVTAESGEQALTLLTAAVDNRQPFQIALIDADMPGMDGMELGQEIRARPEIEKTVLVFMVAMDQEFASPRWKQLRCPIQILKPVRQSQLFEALSTALAAARCGDAILPDDAPATVTSDGHRPPSRPRAERILLAEDNEINQIVATDLLREAGYECDVVGDGVKAIDAVMACKYDLVLMDCQMPLMDGFIAARAIRQSEEAGNASARNGRRIPIIALTANALQGDKERCLEAGMDDYISKPLKPERLFELLARHLSGLEETDTAPSPQDDSETMAGAASSPSTPFDLPKLLNYYKQNLTIIEDLLGKFVAQLERDVASAEEAITSNNPQSLARVAHSLKGAADCLSCPRVVDIAAALEEIGRSANLNEAAHYLSELREELEHCTDFRKQPLAAWVEGSLV